MPNWTSETVILMQQDGGNDRLKMIYQLMNNIYKAAADVEYTTIKGQTSYTTQGIVDAYKKWVQDYPDTTNNAPDSAANTWIGIMLPGLELHHWYENGGRVYTMRSFIDNIQEKGVFSDKETDKAPYILIETHTAWSAVRSFWDELCEKYDLEYEQMAIEETKMFAYNTDITHKYIPYRYIIEYYDVFGDLVDEEYVSNESGLLDVLVNHGYMDSPDDIYLLLANEYAGNLYRSKHMAKEIEDKITVEGIIEAVNNSLKEKDPESEARIQFIELAEEC